MSIADEIEQERRLHQLETLSEADLVVPALVLAGVGFIVGLYMTASPTSTTRPGGVISHGAGRRPLKTDIRASGHGENGAADGIETLALQGELDMSIALHIIERGTRSLAAASAGIVVDLGLVTFMDSSALGALVHLRNEALSSGKTLRVANPQPAVRRVLDLTDMASTLGLSDDI